MNIATGVMTKLDNTVNPMTGASNAPCFVLSDGTNVWVANKRGGPNNTGSIQQINIATGTITEFDDPSINNVDMLAFDGTSLWVTNMNGGPSNPMNSSGSGSITEINTSTGAISVFSGPPIDGPGAISLDSSGHAWVSMNGNGGSIVEFG